MSTFESVVWHILGYSAMPVIILSGFAAVAAICIWLLSMSKDKELEQIAVKSSLVQGLALLQKALYIERLSIAAYKVIVYKAIVDNAAVDQASSLLLTIENPIIRGSTFDINRL